MTGQVQDFVLACVNGYHDMHGDVLEVGSYDVNGSPRIWFGFDGRFPDRFDPAHARFTSYVGVDLRPGSFVDHVMKANWLSFPACSFDVVISTEMLEHDDCFWESVKEMSRVLRPGGYLILTTRSWRGCPPHDYPHDYWRFMEAGLRRLMEYSGLTCLSTVDCVEDGGTFALGRKP